MSQQSRNGGLYAYAQLFVLGRLVVYDNQLIAAVLRVQWVDRVAKFGDSSNFQDKVPWD